MTHQDFFGCRYPILAAPMNQVSDANLAVACYNANIFPSLSAYSYRNDNYKINYEGLEHEIKQFQDKTGSDKILVSVAYSHLLSDMFFDLAINNNIKFLEIIPNEKIMDDVEISLFSKYSEHGVKLLSKIMSADAVKPKADAIMFKGKNGAGRGLDLVDEDKELAEIRNNFPSLPVIMSGGIGTKDDVIKYLNLGCMAVAVGTLLAASEESCLSKETKFKMIESSWKDVTKLENGAQQNGIVFSKIEKDDFNNTLSLTFGIKDPRKGHVFAGKGIDHIKSILPVKDIVQLLVDGL